MNMRMHRPLITAIVLTSLFSSIPAMAATHGASSSTRIKATSSIQAAPRRATKPVRRKAQSSSAIRTQTSKQSGSFPINLLENSQWKIRITSKEDGLLGTQNVFEVSRTKDKLSVSAFERDLRSGKLTQSSGYSADFAKGYLSEDEYLEVQYCWYKYKYIKEGFSCHFSRIPVKITDSKVKGDDSYEFLITGAYDDFTVEVLSKSDKETACNLRGGIHEGEKIFYTKDSPFFKEVTSGFMCFESEKAATDAGYKKSFK